jgi:hypothetical protein
MLSNDIYYHKYIKYKYKYFDLKNQYGSGLFQSLYTFYIYNVEKDGNKLYMLDDDGNKIKNKMIEYIGDNKNTPLKIDDIINILNTNAYYCIDEKWNEKKNIIMN